MTPLLTKTPSYARLNPVSLREVRPEGWILEYLRRQCAGLTGHPAASGYPFGSRFWGSPKDQTAGPGGSWWPYEQTGYWLDGAIKAGYLARDRKVIQFALDEIDFMVDHPAPDGFLGPAGLRKKDRWPFAVVFRAVLGLYSISSDRRYLDALVRHYRATLHPMITDRDVTGVEILLALYHEIGKADLLQAAEELYARFNALMPDHDCSQKTMSSDKSPTEHGVTYNEVAKLGAILFNATGKQDYLEPTIHAYAKLEEEAQLADGLHSCSEHIRGRDPLDSHETCDISDHTWSLGYLLMATRDAAYADQIERVMFNAAPGAITKDFKALQYFSCPNQVVATRSSNHNLFQRGYNWMAYRPGHHVQCCPGNVHRAMPNYVERMWMRGQRETELVAALYGPGRLETSIAGVPVRIRAETRYPFEEGITFHVEPEKPLTFAFTLRIPGWCKAPAITINDQPYNQPLAPGSFQKIERGWRPGDTVRLALPFALALKRWPKSGVSVHYGPLTLSLPVPTQVEVDLIDTQANYPKEFQHEHARPELPGFPVWSMTPSGPWAYALAINEASLAREAKITWTTPEPAAPPPAAPGTGELQPGAQKTSPLSAYPFDPATSPFTVRVPARRVEGWELDRTNRVTQFSYFTVDGELTSGEREIKGDFTLTPNLPEVRGLGGRLASEVEWIALVPYGATTLRMTIFPQAPSV